MSPLPPAVRCLVVVLASCAVGVAGSVAASPPKPTPSPSAAASPGLIGSSSPPADAPVPTVAPTRAAIPVQNVASPPDTPSADNGSLSWLTRGLFLLLLLGNAFAWTRLWTWAPAHGGWRRLFSLSGGRRRKALWQEDTAPVSGSGAWTDDLQQFRTLLDRMQTILGSRPDDPTTRNPGQTTAPRRPVPLGGQPPSEASGASDLQRILQELAVIRGALPLPRPSAVEGRTIALPVGQPAAAEFHPPHDPVSAADRLTDLYNGAARHSRGRDEFLALPGVFRLGVRNSLERLHDAHTEPDFGRHEQGEYLAVPSAHDPGRALVFPRFQAPLNRNSYQAGAVGQVYRCPDYRDGAVYQEVTVVRPATFEEVGAGEWRLIAEGELALGQPA